MQQASPIYQILLQQINQMVLSSLYGLHRHVCMRENVRHAPSETADGVLEGLDQEITELLNSVRCNLVASNGPKHDVPEVSIGASKWSFFHSLCLDALTT